MTTRTKSKFQGVTELRTVLHGPLLEAQRKKFQSAENWEVYKAVIEDEPYPVNFEATLKKYGVVGEAETAFLAELASVPGGAEVFLMTVVGAWYHAKENKPFDLSLFQTVHQWVLELRSENALQGANGKPSTRRMDWVVLNVFKRVSNEFKRGIGSMEGGVCHDC